MFSKLLINWYEKNKRSLPWRDTKDPYFIWLSEVILQQTRVAQGLPYYYRFIEKYPTVQSLANDTQEKVLSLWAGLGYYSRGRNLHSTAQLIQKEYDGVFPKNYVDLLKLKGIGPYTAAAIASFAYKESVPVVDGNVLRVIARVYGITAPINTPKTHHTVRAICEELIPGSRPDTFNQAIMELGALICSPTSPSCDVCPLQVLCISCAQKTQREIPVKIKKKKAVERELKYLILKWKDKVYLKKRIKKDIWFNLYDFFEKTENAEDDLQKAFGLQKTDFSIVKTLNKTHILTHQRLSINFTVIEIKHLHPQFHADFVEIENGLPKPIVIHNILKEIL